MTEDRTERAQQIFLALRELEFADKDHLLNALCGDDTRLRRAVEALIAAEGITQTLRDDVEETFPKIDADHLANWE